MKSNTLVSLDFNAMGSPVSDIYQVLAQSLEEWQLQLIAEAIAQGRSGELQDACDRQLDELSPGLSSSEPPCTPRDIQTLEAELETERRLRQQAEQMAELWRQKFIKAMNYLRRHI
jgi:hypothetical protein